MVDSMGMFRYITNRAVKNKSGEDKGKIKIVVRTGSDTAEVDYVCPECLNSEHIEQTWKRPFSVKCSKCNFLLRLAKLKDELKKEKKKLRR